MIRSVGILFILISLLLVFRSFDKIKYDSYGNEITNNTEGIYATTDGIGVEYFLKNNLQFTSDQVFVVIVSNLVLGLLFFFFYEKLMILFDVKISKLNILLGVFLIILSVFFVFNYNGSYSFFHNRTALFFTGSISLIVFSISNQIWKTFHKNIFYLIFYAFIFFQLGCSIFIELGNYFEPFVHEGNWGQVDGNFIAIFFDGVRHKWTFGYILFRISNILVFLISFYFILKGQSLLQKKIEQK